MVITPNETHTRSDRDEALRHDGSARWKFVPCLQWHEMETSEHLVQFYETDAFLLDSLSGFIGAGLGGGAACIVIATKAHREGLEERLQATGLDLAAASRRGTYLALDASETLSMVMGDGLLVPERFAEVIGSLIEGAVKGRGRMRIFGEMVAQLWTEGNHAAAMRLEELWNELGKTHAFSLLCAYPIHGFAGEGYGEPFTEICQQHSHVIPDESYTLLSSPQERLRTIALLQQKAHSLQAEIVERKRVEEHLRISENRYRRLFEASTDGILMVDPFTGTITDANPSITQLLGYTREQMLGQQLWHIGLFEDQQATLQVLRQLQQDHVLRSETLSLHTKGGQPRYVEFVSTLYQANGHQIIQCNVRDITARKQTEAALRASEERLRLLLQSTDQGICGVDTDGRCTFINRSGARLLGYESEELIGEPMHHLVHHSHPDGSPYPEETCAILQALQRKQGIRLDSEVFWRKDRSCFPVEYSSYPILEDGEMRGAVVTFLDITERKEFERRKEEFLSMASHELKTPLSNMWILTHLLRKQLTEQGFQDSERNLTLLGTQAKQLMKLLTDVLEVSQLEAGYLLYTEELFEVNALVHQIVSTLQQVSPEHPIVITDSAEILLRGDRDRLGQVVTNLLTNAIKYSLGTDPIDVLVASTDGTLTIGVRDYGVGIPAEQQPRIFERFYQAQSPGQTSAPGFGMGLYIAREIVKRHGGQITVESEEGKGSTFTVVLPLKQ